MVISVMQLRFKKEIDQFISQKIILEKAAEDPRITLKRDVVTIGEIYKDPEGNIYAYHVNLRISADGTVIGMNNVYAKVCRHSNPLGGYVSSPASRDMYNKLYAIIDPYFEKSGSAEETVPKSQRKRDKSR